MTRLEKLVTKHDKKKPVLAPPKKFAPPKRRVGHPGIPRKIPLVKKAKSTDPSYPRKSNPKKGECLWMRTAKRDKYGLPIPPAGIGKRGPDINKALNSLLHDFTEEQLVDIIARCQDLSMHWRVRIQQVLDADSPDPSVRSRALRLIDERLHGAAKQTIDNVNPLLALLDPASSKLKPRA
jgi:hypothetical protein